MVSSATARSRRLPPLVIAAALVASLALAAPATAAGAAKPFRLNLYRDGDFVSQTNSVQCVGTSMQIMINMMRPRNDRSAKRQLELQDLARKYSPRFYNGTEAVGQVRQRRGASSRGWAFGLMKLGFGPYKVTSAGTLQEAVRWAAVAMRRTGRPVGLLVWEGAHAWVMSGFAATGDPLMDDEAKITHVFVQDPFYPRVSRTWGRSAAPNTKLALKQLDDDFVPWRPGRATGMSGRFVIVAPLVTTRPFDRRTNNLD